MKFRNRREYLAFAAFLQERRGVAYLTILPYLPGHIFNASLGDAQQWRLLRLNR